MTIQIQIPSMEDRINAIVIEEKRRFDIDLKTWLDLLKFGLPIRKGETVWFQICRDMYSFNDDEHAIAEAIRIYRAKGYLVRALYSGCQCDTFDVLKYTVFELTELDHGNPKHTRVNRPRLWERIACRLQYDLKIPRSGRRYAN